MSLTIDEAFSLLGEAIISLQGKGKIMYEEEDEETGETTKTQMDLHTYILRAFAETLVDKGVDKEEVTKATEGDSQPTGNPHVIRVLSMGGRKKTLRRRRV